MTEANNETNEQKAQREADAAAAAAAAAKATTTPTNADELKAARDETTAAKADAAAATSALIDAQRLANPTIPPHLIAGSTPAEVTASVEAGKKTVADVLEANKTTSAPGGNAGAPPRTNDAPEGARGVRLIAHALKQENQQ